MKQLVWPSKLALSGSPAQEADDVAGQDLAFEVGDRAGLGSAHVGGVADDEDVRAGLGLQGVLVGRDEAERVAEAWRAADVGLAAVHGHRHGQVEADLAAVEGDEPAAVGVDLAGVELGDQLDALVVEHAAQLAVADGLGERAVQRGDEGHLDPVADPALAEVPVGQEAELDRGDRALDRHVDDVHRDPAAVEPRQRVPQGHRPGWS